MADTTTVSTVTVTAPAPKRPGVTTYQPQVSVVLLKNISRTKVGGDIAASSRFTGSNRTIDLTPYLGDGSVVVTRKSVKGGAGQWSVSLTDQPAPGQLESLYGLIEPLDIVEIRMAHDMSSYFGAYPKHMPIRMRGFVSEVRRRRTMTRTGPVRAVVLSGQDYGRILEQINITYLPGLVIGQDLLSAYKLFLNYGPGVRSDQTAADFITAVVQNIVGPFIANMRQAVAGSGGSASSPVMDFGVHLDVQGGSISPFGSQEWQGGSVDALLRYFGDVGPWNELYVEDREDGPYIVYRPTPYKTLSGDFIQDIPNPPTVIKIPDADVVEEDIGRSDADIANYYWVDAPRYNLVDGALLQAAVAGGLQPPALLSEYTNASPALYGIRPMQTQTQQGPRIDGQGQAQLDAGRGQGLDIVNERRRVLIANNMDNVVLESGSFLLRGNEQIKAGCYISRPMGSVSAEYYVESVEDRFAVFRDYTMTVTVDRGMGFVSRAQQGGGVNAPYLTELNLGGVYGS